MNDTPAKSPFASLTVWGIVIAALAGLLAVFDIEVTAEEQGKLATALAIFIGTVMAIVGRYRAKQPLKTPGAKLPPALDLIVLAALLLIGGAVAAPMAGCQHIEKTGKAIAASPEAQATLARAIVQAVTYGLGQLAARVNETRPWIEPILPQIGPQFVAQVPFAGADGGGTSLVPPAQAAANLRALVAQSGAPPEIHAQILANIRETLSLPPPPAAGGADPAARDEAAYRAAVAAAL